jgi:hypothetical protein
MSAVPPIPKPASKPSIAEVFARQAFVVVNRLAPPETLAAVAAHMRERTASGGAILGDYQAPGTPSIYGGPVLDGLLAELLPKAEFCTGLKLFPTYCYGRIYRHGDDLKRHCDRAACEISISLNLGQEPDEPWALHLGVGDRDVPVHLRPGDGLFYRGIDLPHWREPYSGQSLTQVFAHYVDQNGPHRHEKFDRRVTLSVGASRSDPIKLQNPRT